MSNAIFPALPGLMWDVKRRPLFQTKVQRSVSGKELRAAFYSAPLWEYDLSYEFLRDGVQGELQTLQAFFLQRQGSFDSFLWADPNDNAVTAHGFGVGDGTTTAFQLQRAYLGTNQQDYWSGLKTQQFTSPRTNLVIQSGDFTQASWTKTSLTDNGAAVDPAGSLQARAYTATAGGATITQTIAGLTVGKIYTVSIYLLCVAGTTLKIGTTEGVGSAVTLTSAYQRVSLTFTAAGTSTVLTIGAGSSWTNGVGVQVAFAQVEQAASATPYIGTASAAVTVTPNYWPKTGDGFEPIYNLNPATPLQIYINGTLKTPGTDYTVSSSGLVTFASPPAVGAVLTWTGAYFWRVRFAMDAADFNNFQQTLWDLKTVNLVSTK